MYKQIRIATWQVPIDTYKERQAWSSDGEEKTTLSYHLSFSLKDEPFVKWHLYDMDEIYPW